MKPGKTMNDSAHGIPDTNMKLDEEGGPHKHPDQVLDQPAYVSKFLPRPPPLLSCQTSFLCPCIVSNALNARNKLP